MVQRAFLAAALAAVLPLWAPAQSPKAPPDPLDGPPFVTAKAWAVADGKTGKLLGGGRETEPRPIASTTKVMTAWVVLGLAEADAKVLDEIVTFSDRADKTGGSSSNLLAGDRLPVHDLLYGLLLPSGNDAAVALAEHFGPRFRGDKPAGTDPVSLFVAEMNRRAKALKLADTTYLDPHGLAKNLSTAKDLAVLAATALGSERFRKYVGTREYACDVTGADGKKRPVTWENTNRLLGTEGYDGVKTGTTTPAGACLIASGRRGDDHLIVVILGATSTDGRYTDARNLFRWGWHQKGVKPETPAKAAADPLSLAGAVVVVDPGHGGQGYSKNYTGGTKGVSSGRTEGALNLAVGLELAAVLRAKGAAVFLTREADHRLSREGGTRADELNARVDFLDHFNPHFFLSVHHNAGPAAATGHTALYKNNAADDTLYEALARDVNAALDGAVPGPTRKLIRGDYHVLRETAIPGTIAESGFMTNKAFDDLSGRPDFPKAEAAAIADGAVRYWTAHKPALVALRDKLAKERAAHPRDPSTFAAVDLNPAFREKIGTLVDEVDPADKPDPAKVADYVAAFKAATKPKTFDVTAAYDGKKIKLAGTADKASHDTLLDLLVAMKLYAITNDVRIAP